MDVFQRCLLKVFIKQVGLNARKKVFEFEIYFSQSILYIYIYIDVYIYTYMHIYVYVYI